VSFWKHLPSWIDEGSVRPLRYEVVEGLDGRRLMKYWMSIGMEGSGKVHVHPDISVVRDGSEGWLG
jgi:hypothetical protein